MMDVGRDPERIVDYIAGRLSEEEHRAFGERLVRDAGLVRELERTLQMREGLQQLQAQGYLDTAAPQKSRSRIWLPALAAAAALAVLGLSLWVRVSSERPTLLSASLTAGTPEIAARFTFVSTRGSATPLLDLPDGGLIEFRAAVAPAAVATGYGVTLLREEETHAPKPLGSLSGVTSATDGFLHVYAGAARLLPGRYILRVQPDTGAGAAAQSFPFTLTARGRSPTP